MNTEPTVLNETDRLAGMSDAAKDAAAARAIAKYRPWGLLAIPLIAPALHGLLVLVGLA